MPQISSNYVPVLIEASENGISVSRARELDQRTLSWMVTRTHSRGRLLDFDARINKFVLTQDGRKVLHQEINRQAKNKEQLSRGLQVYTMQVNRQRKKKH